MPARETNAQIERRLEKEANPLLTYLCALGTGDIRSSDNELAKLCGLVDKTREEFVLKYLTKGTERESKLALNFLAKAFFRYFLKPMARGTFAPTLFELVEKASPEGEVHTHPTLHFLKLVRWRYNKIKNENEDDPEATVTPEGFADKVVARAMTDVLYALVSRSVDRGVYPRTSDPTERELARMDRNAAVFDVPCLVVLRWNSFSLVASSSNGDPRTAWSVAKQTKRLQGAVECKTTKRASYAVVREASRAKKTGQNKYRSDRSDVCFLATLHKACRDSLKDAYAYEEAFCGTGDKVPRERDEDKGGETPEEEDDEEDEEGGAETEEEAEEGSTKEKSSASSIERLIDLVERTIREEDKR